MLGLERLGTILIGIVDNETARYYAIGHKSHLHTDYQDLLPRNLGVEKHSGQGCQG